MKRKILYITGTRADYGLMRSALKCIDNDTKLSLRIAVTGMHLMEEFGDTMHEIENDNFDIVRLNAVYESDDKESMACFIGTLIQQLTNEIRKNRPDIILVLGDRGEMLAGAVVGSYLGIPVAHIHGGEITSTIDDITRHAITKMSHIHLATTTDSAQRITRMGEDPSHIFIVGAPGLDQIMSGDLISREKTFEKYYLDPARPYAIIAQHPVSLEVEFAQEQMKTTLDAVIQLEIPAVIIYPNADAGGRKMIEVIEQYSSSPDIHICRSIPHREYLSLLKNASVLIGNSSSGIIEAPSLGVPVVNIGSRQQGRQRGINVIDVNYNKDEIIRAIRKSLEDTVFIKKVRQCNNPYGDGKSSEKIVEILRTIKIDPSLIQKRMIY